MPCKIISISKALEKDMMIHFCSSQITRTKQPVLRFVILIWNWRLRLTLPLVTQSHD